jgi:hypothetical protein
MDRLEFDDEDRKVEEEDLARSHSALPVPRIGRLEAVQRGRGWFQSYRTRTPGRIVKLQRN